MSENYKLNCRYFRCKKPCRFKRFCDGCHEYDPVRDNILIIKLAAMGDVYFCPDYKRSCLGNISKNNVRLYTEPQPYGGRIDGTVDGIASFLELKRNHVISFAKQWGGYKENGKVLYKNLYADFNSPEIRKRYVFPDRFTKLRLKFGLYSSPLK